MKLISAKVGPFRSLNSEQIVAIDPDVTVLVGMNEAGKTVFLKGLYKSSPAIPDEKFDPIEDYPRRNLSSYLKKHSTAPEAATKLSYELSENEIAEINRKFHTDIQLNFGFTVTHKYDNSWEVAIAIDEKPVVAQLVNSDGIPKGPCQATSTTKESVLQYG